MAKKRKLYSWGEIICGTIGLILMGSFVDLFPGDSTLGAGVECSLGYLFGAVAYHVFRYIFRKDRAGTE